MPQQVVGGLWITEYEFTRSFGVEPASASGKAVLGAGEFGTGLEVGEYVTYSFNAITFYGIISSIIATTERQTGREYTFQIVDNRVRLPWQIFFAQYNMAEDADAVHAGGYLSPPSGAFSAGGATGSDGVDLGAGPGGYEPVLSGDFNDGSIARGRIYRHRVPAHWGGGFSSYTAGPVSARDVLRSAFKAALGGFGYTLDFHPDQDQPLFDVDANNGMTLAALVAMACDAQGLQVTLDGSRTLRFVRRGDGPLLLPPPPAHVARDGEAMSADPTKVRVVGDRTLVQVNNVPLVPDWKPGWEKFISEPAWLDEVNRVFGPFDDQSPAGRAELAAKAREVTLRQYILEADDVVRGDFADYGRWGNGSRLNMEVWTYLNAIVFRSYVIGDTLLYGVPMRALELHDSLLCAVEIKDTGEGDASIGYRGDPVEFYPQASAYVIAKGQPLDLLDTMDREAAVKLRVKDMRSAWSEIGDFTLDAANHAIRFSTPVFIDGDPAEGKTILLLPNQGQGGYDDVSGSLSEDSDYARVVVPNPDYEISAAEVKVSLVFRLGPFHRDFGSGARWTVQSCPALAEHLLDTTGSSITHARLGSYEGDLHMPNPGESLREILYDDGASAIEKAAAAAEGVISKSPVERSGELIRHGTAGYMPSSVIDRVTIKIDLQNGIVERVEFAKPRTATGFVGSREFSRRVRQDTLYDGQADLRKEVRRLRAIARLSRNGANDPVRSRSHKFMGDVLKTPIGGPNPGLVTYSDPNGAYPERGIEDLGWRAGDIVWLDATGVPARDGQTFGGVVVAKTSAVTKHVTAAISGTVPMAVAPGTGPAAVVSAEPGNWKGGASGSYPLGMLAHGESVPGSGEATMALVRLGAGGSGGEAGRAAPLALMTDRPSYYPVPTGAVADGYRRVWIRLGSCMGKLADNYGEHFDCQHGEAGEGETAIPDTWFWAKIYLGAGTFVNVTHWEIVKGTTADAFANPPWPPGGARPNVHYHPLGRYLAASGTLFSTGGGSLIVSENIVNIENGPRLGVPKITRGIYVQREGY